MSSRVAYPSHLYICTFVFPIPECSSNKTDIVDNVKGFLQIPWSNYSVQFIRNNGDYSVKVSWKAPRGIKILNYNKITMLCSSISIQRKVTNFDFYDMYFV